MMERIAYLGQFETVGFTSHPKGLKTSTAEIIKTGKLTDLLTQTSSLLHQLKLLCIRSNTHQQMSNAFNGTCYL